MADLDINLLRSLIAFADTGSCDGAARVVHKTQSAVSIHLKRLEEIVGQPLFDKAGRRLRLNRDGQDLLSYARRMLQLHSEALGRFGADEFAGAIRVGLPDDYVPVLLNSLLSEFAAAYPKAQFDLHCAPSAELRPMLADNQLDLAVLSAETDTQEGLALKREPAFWIAARGYRHDVETELRLILFPDGCIMRKWGLNGLRRSKRDFRIVCTSRNMLALQAAVRGGLGVMIVTKSNIPEGCVVLGEKDGFPKLPDVTILLAMGPSADDRIGRKLASHLLSRV